MLKRELPLIVKTLIKDVIKDNAFLNRMSSGDVSKVEWQLFAAQRYLASLDFTSLLSSGAAACFHAQDFALARIFYKNLCDEVGAEEEREFSLSGLKLLKGVKLNEKSHETWRRDFYTEIGVTKNDLLNSLPSKETLMHKCVLESLIFNSSYLKKAGAVLFLEGFIPQEFKILKTGRDFCFPETSQGGKLYIDDHILHDAKQHFPELLKDLVLKSESELTEVLAGVKSMAKAKKVFYEQF